MKHDSTEQKIAAAFRAVTPNLKPPLLSEGNEFMKGEQAMNTEQTPKQKKTRWAAYGALAAALLLVLGLGFGSKLIPARQPDPAARIMIDVNPSIALLLDRSDRVISAEAKNDDGAKVLADMDLAGTDAKVALNAIVGAMLRQGYLSELANSVLITVDSDDEGRSLRLRDSLSADARDYLQNSGLDCSILSQILEPGGASAAAEQYGVSPGKALLIGRLAAANPRYDIPGLSALSIHELSLLLGHNAIEEVHASGQSSEKAYIGREAAEEIALLHAGVSRSEAAKLKSELEYENGGLVYEVEFEAQGKEFEYDVDAVSGEIRKVESEPLETNGTPAPDDDDDPDDLDDDDPDDLDDDDPDDLDDDDDDNYDDRPDEDWDDDDDLDDDVDDDDVDDDEPALAAPTQPAPTEAALISSDRALEIALSSLGADRGSIQQLELELTRENGSPVYELEFQFDGFEHDFEIDAGSGNILLHVSEPED